MVTEEKEILKFDKIHYPNIIVENSVVEVKSHDLILHLLNLNDFISVSPHVIKYLYYYPDGVLKIIPREPFEIHVFSAHIEVKLEVKQ